MREVLEQHGEEVPEDLAMLFEDSSNAGVRALDYLEFMATAIAAFPEIYCRESMLKAVFNFLNSGGAGVIDGHDLHQLFPERPTADCTAMVREACGQDSLSYTGFCGLMTPDGWEATAASPASWAEQPAEHWEDDLEHLVLPASALDESSLQEASQEQPLLRQASAVADTTPHASHRHHVKSAPSEAFAIRQGSGFHRATLLPFYASETVSNVVIGIARGSSGYARRAMAIGCAEVVISPGGAFFIMPNPKYHRVPEAALNTERKARFVAWWIHPELCTDLFAWTSDVAAVPGPLDRGLSTGSEEPAAMVEQGVGAPGDFGFSDVQKHPGYLHTCRDLAGEEHLRMMDALVGGIKRYLERVIGDALPGAHVSAGFHYPVRPQYSTMHLQLRVNSGDVCPGEGRGVDLFRLLQKLREDPCCFHRDDETLFYEATANLRVALLSACDQAGTCAREVGPRSLVLGEH